MYEPDLEKAEKPEIKPVPPAEEAWSLRVSVGQKVYRVFSTNSARLAMLPHFERAELLKEAQADLLREGTRIQTG